MAAKAEDDHKVGSIEEEDVEQLILKSGVPKSGDQKARKFEIDKVDAELSKFVTTILEGHFPNLFTVFHSLMSTIYFNLFHPTGSPPN